MERKKAYDYVRKYCNDNGYDLNPIDLEIEFSNNIYL